MNYPWLSHKRRPHRQAGFGVIEAVVALMLLAGVGFTLLSWIHQNLDTLQRLRGYYARVEIQKSALEWSRSINPMERPAGEIQLGDYRLVWQSRLLGAVTPQSGLLAGSGLYDLALYEMKIEAIYRGDTQPVLVQKITAIGYRRARENSKAPI